MFIPKNYRSEDVSLLKKIINENSDEKLTIDIDGVRAFGSSFIEEAFGGLIRLGYFKKEEVKRLIVVKCTKEHLRFYKDFIDYTINASAYDPAKK